MANTLTGLIPVMYDALDLVQRELVGFIPAASIDAKADQAAVGQTITTPITPAATTGDIVPGQMPPDDGDQALGTIQMQITKSKYSPIRWSGEELQGFMQTGAYRQTLANQFAQSIRALTNLVEADLAAAAYQGASRAYGTAGSTPFGTAGDLTDFAGVRKILEDNGAPMSDVHLILNTAAAANIRGKQSVLWKVNESGSDALLRQGTLTEVEGFKLGLSAQIKQVTKGTGTSYATSGSTAVGGQSIALVTGSGTVLAGDVATFAADSVNKYVVGTGVAAPGTISLNDPGAQIVIPTGNAMTIGGNFTPNVAFERSALKLLARSPIMPTGPDGKAMDDADDVLYLTDPLTGLTFQVAVYKLYRRIKYEVGLAWGVKNIKGAYSAILLG